MDKMSLRYSEKLHNLDWTNIIHQNIPYINNQRKKIILHVSGQFSINPLLLLSKLVLDQNELSHISKSDEEFRLSIKSFANQLSSYGQEFDAVKTKAEMSRLEYSLRNALNNDEGLMNDFIGISDYILERHDIFYKTGATKSIVQRGPFKRNEDEHIELELPYSSSQCWQLSATHFGALETEGSSATNGKMSSIDLAPSLYQKWYVPFDYLGSNGEVYSSHGGKVYKHSECSIEVVHEKTRYSTYYSHLELNDFGNGTFIEQGHHLGNISLVPDNSNCRCDYANKLFECATGPHVHFELRYDGEPESLQDRIISNFRIRTGSLPYDLYCSDPIDCTLATYEGKFCATTYTDLTTGGVICPVTKGSNIGRKHLLPSLSKTSIISTNI